MKFLVATLGSAVVAVALGAGCSSKKDSNSCALYVPPAGTDLTTPAVAFKKDVVPIFVQSCAFSSCHGETSGDNQGVYLGSKTGDPDAERIYKAIVGVASRELSSMNYVSAGSTGNSYLLHKIDGDICTLNAQCRGGTCQDTMPQGNELLPVETRDVVRRWIAQGAKDD